MAHEIEFVNGVAQHVYVGETPWHNLGKRVSADLTPHQMMVEAGLDWTVSKVPLFAEVGGKRIKTGAEALIRDRDSSVLSVVTDTWNPLQNEEAFEFFNDFVMEGDVEMHTAGSLKNGQHVWALAKIKESFSLFNGKDQVDSYLLFSNPHIFGKSIDVRFTPIRVVCNNTLTLSLNSTSQRMAKVSHRREFDADAVKETMGIAHEKFSKYREMAEFLSSKRYTADSIIEYFNTVFPKTSGSTEENNGVLHSRAAKLAYDTLENQPGAEFGEGTYWSAYNSVTYLTDHLLGRTDDTRIYSSWFGTNQTKKVNALNLAVEMATAA